MRACMRVRVSVCARASVCVCTHPRRAAAAAVRFLQRLLELLFEPLPVLLVVAQARLVVKRMSDQNIILFSARTVCVGFIHICAP